MPHRNIDNWLSLLPFVGLVMNPGTPTPIIMRLVEAGIIGAVVMYGTTQRIEAKFGTDIGWIKAELREVKQDVKELHRSVYGRNGS